MTPWLNDDLDLWLRRRVRATGWVKEYSIEDNAEPPYWEHADGSTKWGRGRPVRYTRSVSIIHVGMLWLAKAFPAAWARMRLLGDDCLSVTPAELLDFDQSERLRITAEAFSTAAFARNAICWQDIVRQKGFDRSTDPENERHYAP